MLKRVEADISGFPHYYGARTVVLQERPAQPASFDASASRASCDRRELPGKGATVLRVRQSGWLVGRAGAHGVYCTVQYLSPADWRVRER